MIVIFNDNRRISQMLYGNIELPNKHTQDVAAVVTKILEIVSKATITISIEWKKGYPKVYPPF